MSALFDEVDLCGAPRSRGGRSDEQVRMSSVDHVWQCSGCKWTCSQFIFTTCQHAHRNLRSTCRSLDHAVTFVSPFIATSMSSSVLVIMITHSHGSARVNATKQVNGKGQNSTPRHTKTP